MPPRPDPEPPARDDGPARRTARKTSGRRAAHGVAAAARWLAPVLALLLRALARSWRVRFEGPDPFERAARVGAIWHSDLLAAAGVFRDRPLHVSVSRSRDGDMAVAIMGHLGFATPPRGSSRRGGVGLLRGIDRLLAEGRQVVIPVDGPVGPARVAKPGVFRAAHRAGTPIYMAALAARPCLRFRSWDRMRLPLPFAQVVCCFGEPLPVEDDPRGEALAALQAALGTRLDALAEAAEAALVRPASRL